MSDMSTWEAEGNDIWRSVGVKNLLKYISSADGERHDVVVYDSGCEFDRCNPEAVRFIASVVMAKAEMLNRRYPVFSYRMAAQTDGSVVPITEVPKNETMLQSSMDRKKREDEAKWTYIPDAEEYVKYIRGALNNRYIHISDMTEDELKKFRRDTIKNNIIDGVEYAFVRWVPYLLYAGVIIVGIWFFCMCAFNEYM